MDGEGGYREGRQGVQRVHLKHENVDRDPDPAQVRVMQQNVESYQRPCYYTICVTLTPDSSYEIMGIQNSNSNLHWAARDIDDDDDDFT